MRPVSSRSRSFVIVLLSLGVSLGAVIPSPASASTVRLRVTVKEAAEITFPSGQEVTLQARPGERAQGSLSVQLRSNAPWVLRLAADRRPVLPGETPLVNLVQWQASGRQGTVGQASLQDVASGQPTGESGVTITFAFEYTASYDDAPGDYAADIDLVLAAPL